VTVAASSWLAEIGPGWELWMRQHPLSEVERGGICVEVEHTVRANTDTGELVPAIRYRCLNGARATWLYADQVDVERSQFSERGAWATVLLLLRQVVVKKKYAPVPSASDRLYLADAFALFRALR
jgi:hypothetical protein